MQPAHSAYKLRSVINTRSTLALSNRVIRFRGRVGLSAGEDGVEHGRRDTAGERVLLARVITADEQHFVRSLGGLRLGTLPLGVPSPGMVQPDLDSVPE